MKRGKVLMTVLVVLAVLFASCSNGMSKDDASGAAHTEKVLVSLGVDVEGAVSQKAISSDTDLSGMTYWYKAQAGWAQDRPIHGETKDGEGNYIYVMIPNYRTGASKNIGYFTAGEWKFWAQVKKGDAVIYSSPVAGTPYTIFTGNTNPTITVKPATGSNGSISFNVKVPATGGETPTALTGERLIVWVNNSPEGVSVSRTGYADGLATYEGSKTGLTPGAYTVSFRYMDEGNAWTEGAAQAVTVFAGQESNITGTIDAGKWHPTSITIKAPGIDPFTLTPESAHRTPNDPVATVFTASATSTQGRDITYKWYIGGDGPQNVGSASLSYSLNTPGMYDITCTATTVEEDGVAPVIASKTVYVQVGYAVTAPTAPITMGTAQTVFAPGDIVPLNYTGDLTNLTVTGVATADIEWDNATHKASFRMPAQNATITGTFAP